MTTAQPPAYNDNCANKKQPYEAFSYIVLIRSGLFST